MARVVMVAVDDSQQAVDAFNWYLTNLRQEGDELVVAYCTEIPYIPVQPIRADVVQNLMDRAQDEAQKVVNRYKSLIAEKGIRGRVANEFGHAGDYIVKTAEKEKAACIVMGTRGMGKIRRTLLGSVSDHVIHHAHCPVLVCRECSPQSSKK